MSVETDSFAGLQAIVVVSRTTAMSLCDNTGFLLRIKPEIYQNGRGRTQNQLATTNAPKAV